VKGRGKRGRKESGGEERRGERVRPHVNTFLYVDGKFYAVNSIVIHYHLLYH